MKIAHVRERHAPAGAPWRLAAALEATSPVVPEGVSPEAEVGMPPEATPAPSWPSRWLDLEVARRRLVATDERLAHNDARFRERITTLDDHLGAGHRIEALRPLLDAFAPRPAEYDDDAILDAVDLAFGPPILRPPSLRDFYAFEGHVATMWARRDNPVPDAWYRLPIFYFSNVSEIRGPGDPVWAPRGSAELDFELEVAGIVDTPARDLVQATAEEAIGGYCILNDWSARDLQREETAVRLGPAKGKDFASSIGPWLVTPEELADARAPGGTGPDLAMTAEVNGIGISWGRWSESYFSFGDMLARASADVSLRPGDLIGSGTVGTGCLLEVKDERLGRYLEPGDSVTLRIERLGELTSPIVERPS